MSAPAVPHLVLYDGTCGLCAGLVKFILARDRSGAFHFAALQSEMATALLAQLGVAQADLTTFYLVEAYTGSAPQLFSSSTASLHVGRHLGAGWRMLAAAGWVVPRVIRDAMYAFVASRRKRWFGEHEACMLPTPEIRAKFPAGYL